MQLIRSDFDRLMQVEGGYSQNPNDTGNKNACGEFVGSNHGITANKIQDRLGIKCPSRAYMENLSLDTAYQVLQLDWNHYRFDELHDGMAFVVFQAHMGNPRNCAKSIQRACNRFGSGLAVDGSMGSLTIAAVNNLAIQNLPAIYNAFRDEFKEFIAGINQDFRQGWYNRINVLMPVLNEQYTQQGQPIPKPSSDVAITTQAYHVVKGASKGNLRDIVWVTIAFVLVLAIFFLSMPYAKTSTALI
jgi:lysozyme family protein